MHFIKVTLAASGGEGGRSMGAMRWAQTANYGVAPNPAMPRTFLAQAFDLDDPFSNITCYRKGCCGPAPKEGCESCLGPDGYCESLQGTNYYMGPIHPRDKKPVGDRLASAAINIAYGKKGTFTGPTLSGCHMVNGKIIVHFNRSLLASDELIVKDYRSLGSSRMEVLTNKSLFCLQTSGREDTECIDDGTGHASGSGPFEDSKTWVSVDVQQESPTSLTVDLSKTQGVAFGLRYAWKGDCCDERPPSGAACPIASCPLMAKSSNLPANPFLAKIVNGKCQCVAPQQCEESLSEMILSMRVDCKSKSLDGLASSENSVEAKEKRSMLSLFDLFERVSSGSATPLDLTEASPLDVFVHRLEDGTWGLFCSSHQRLLAFIMRQACNRNELMRVRCVIRSKEDLGYWSWPGAFVRPLGWHWNCFYDGTDGRTMSPKAQTSPQSSPRRLGLGFSSSSPRLVRSSGSAVPNKHFLATPWKINMEHVLMEVYLSLQADAWHINTMFLGPVSSPRGLGPGVASRVARPRSPGEIQSTAALAAATSALGSQASVRSPKAFGAKSPISPSMRRSKSATASPRPNPSRPPVPLVNQ
eukprot:symbB.v1.2.006568.t1/scaffold392.1/size213825/4